MLHEELTGVIRQVAFEIHEYFGIGFLEKVYENALAHRLRKRRIVVQQQPELSVRDRDGFIVGVYRADLLVENKVLVELKAAQSLTDLDTRQTIHYLKATGTKVGLLVNFGSYRFQFKRFVY